MQLDITKALNAPGEDIPFSLAEPMEPTEWNGDTLRFIGPVEVKGTVAALHDTAWVRAEVTATLSLPCAACLEPARRTQTAKLDACYMRAPDPDDPDLFAFEGHTLSLDDAVLGAILLAMPMRILCSDTCRGICPTCGANRNQTQCACQNEGPSKHPFSALASLLTKDEEV